MNRPTEALLTLAVCITVPSGLLWLIGLCLGALQEWAIWHTWPDEAQAALWFCAATGATGLLLYLVRQLMRLAAAWPARRRP